MEPKSKTEKLIEDLRKTPIFRQVIPMEAQIGWPLPVRREYKVYVTFIFFGAKNQGQGETILFPPFAKMTLDWSNQTPVEYTDFRFENPWKDAKKEGQIGTFPHRAIASLKVEEYLKKRRELLEMYDEMLFKLSQRQSLSSEWNNRFSQLLRLLLEPSLEPYYRVLAPKFFDRFLPQN